MIILVRSGQDREDRNGMRENGHSGPIQRGPAKSPLQTVPPQR